MFDSLTPMICQFPQALAGGLLTAGVCSLLGVFMVLRRVVFIGITLSEVAALGIALALGQGLPPLLGASLLTVGAVSFLALPTGKRRLPAEASMGVVFVAASALAILLVARSGFGLQEVKALIYGDLILISGRDLVIMATVLLPCAGAVLLFMRPILLTMLDRDLARVQGMRVLAWELLFFYCLGLAVSASSQAAGALLVFAYLVAPSSAALLLSHRMKLVLLWSVLAALAFTMAGLAWSFGSDLPANQSIAVLLCAWFAAVFIWHKAGHHRGR